MSRLKPSLGGEFGGAGDVGDGWRGHRFPLCQGCFPSGQSQRRGVPPRAHRWAASEGANRRGLPWLAGALYGVPQFAKRAIKKAPSERRAKGRGGSRRGGLARAKPPRARGSPRAGG